MNPAQPNSNVPDSRILRLKRRFFDVLSGSVKLDPRGASLFLEGLCAQDDPVACLGTVIESPHGLSAVQSAMSFDLSLKFMNGLGSAVLAYLLRVSELGGDALDSLLFCLVDPPIFWTAFVRVFQLGKLTEDSQLVFARLLSRLLTLQNQDTTPYRDIAAQHFVQDVLAASSRQEMREIGYLIKHILCSSGSISIRDAFNGPSGRHDNDFSNFHDISILPTADEIMCRKPPYLRPPLDDEHRTSETSFNEYLDNIFRMLREDMLFDIREEVQTSSRRKGKHRSVRDIGRVSMVGVYTGMGARRTRWGVKLQCDVDFKELSKIKEKNARVDFLTRDRHGSKILRHQSLVCLTSDQDIISFGTMNRMEELLASEPPIVVLQLDGIINTRKTLASFSIAKNLRLMQLNAAAFSFEPVLTALQKMGSIPLAEKIVSWNPETDIVPPRNPATLLRVTNAVTSDLSIDLKSLLDLPTSICLDESQARSLITGLTTPVSLIQGPPGTGKSFIGTILAKVMHDKTPQTILVVCYTNHALDQFLGDLLKYGIPGESIVRLGSRSSQSTEHLSLHKQLRRGFRYDWDGIDELKGAAGVEENNLEICFDELIDVQDDEKLMSYLELQRRDFFEAFNVPLETEDGMIRIGQNGKAIGGDYLFSRWIRGLDAGVLSGDPNVQASAWIWGMDHSTRQQLLAEWRRERVTEATESVCQAGQEYNRVQDMLNEKFEESTVAILRQKRIIAGTTTGAAIYAKAINQVGPKALLVEEAGEILESHVLTALSRKVERLILIGDHKQLRPKVNNYRLTVEHGDGFDLNRSLFERLVLKGYPHETLSTQHRMRPEISAFVRELTYPELVDAPFTRQRPDIRGVLSNVMFVDHDHPEDDSALVGDRADGGASTSKRNTYEAQMTVSIVRYLIQQGYNSEDIVVLTPYLGQLQHLRDALKRDVDPILNDLDSSDLARAGISTTHPGPKAKKSGIHLATIDNYQGEESDIVVASLTRANKSNSIGFMDSPERLNVLLSRARNGLILIGNSRTFLHSKKGGVLWRKFFALIEKGQYAYRGFPVKCDRHSKRVALLKRPSDFNEHCPDGGCMDKCGFTLACGHVCRKRCHPRRPPALLSLHDASQCREKMSATCPAGHHKLVWECRSGPSSDCPTCAEEARRLEEIALEALELQRKREEAEAEHRRRMAELEAELKREAEEEHKRQEEKHKQEELKRKMEKEQVRREEECKKREEKQRKQQEKKNRKERKMQCEQEKREQKALQLHESARQMEEERRNREEGIRMREEEARRLQEAALREQEEREKQEHEKRKREEQTGKLREAASRRREERRQEKELRSREEQRIRLQEATCRRREEKRQEEELRSREEQRIRLQEATCRRREEKRQEEELRSRGEQRIRLQEATCRRREEAERQRQQEAKRRREEQTERLREATSKRLEEEEQRMREEDTRAREEQLVRQIQEATVRRHKEKQQNIFEQQMSSRGEQTKRLWEATCRRRGGQPSDHQAVVKVGCIMETSPRQQVSKCWQLQGNEDDQNIKHGRQMAKLDAKLRVEGAADTICEQKVLCNQAEDCERHEKRNSKRAVKKERKREEMKKKQNEAQGNLKGKTTHLPTHHSQWQEVAAALPWNYRL